MSQIDLARDAQSNTQTTEPLILQHYAEIARYAVQLARDRIAIVVEDNFLRATCGVCLNVGEPNAQVQHDESCILGRIFALNIEIAQLRANAHPRTIEYFAYSTGQGGFVPLRLVTHEQAARAQVVTA
jgi:hypothetical protein